jgi:hypothetical protein
MIIEIGGLGATLISPFSPSSPGWVRHRPAPRPDRVNRRQRRLLGRCGQPGTPDLSDLPALPDLPDPPKNPPNHPKTHPSPISFQLAKPAMLQISAL